MNQWWNQFLPHQMCARDAKKRPSKIKLFQFVYVIWPLFQIFMWNHGGTAGIILCMCPGNKRRCYIVTSSLIGWAHTQNDPWNCSLYDACHYSVTALLWSCLAYFPGYLVLVYCLELTLGSVTSSASVDGVVLLWWGLPELQGLNYRSGCWWSGAK